DTQAELQSLREKLARSPASKSHAIESQIAEVQSEIGLLNARRDAIESISDFVTSSKGTGSVGLRAQIEELARSVPPDLSRPSAGQDAFPGQSSSAAALDSVSGMPSGIWELAGDLIRLTGTLRTLNNDIKASDSLASDAGKLRSPLIENMHSLVRR